MPVIVVQHPILNDCLAQLRNRRTRTPEFRSCLSRAATVLVFEALRTLPLRRVRVETPLGRARGEVLAGPCVVAVPVLRAGLGMLPGFLHLFPSAIVGVIGLRRDEKTFLPHEYCRSLPEDLSNRTVIILDPMLATGGSMVAAIRILKERNAADVRAITLVAAPEGVLKVKRHYPEVTVYTAAIDARLNRNAYIIPGIGDAGDRLFGTQ